jgi:hypothetical protein
MTMSILDVFLKELLDEELMQLIEEYGRSATEENLNHLISKVCQTLGFIDKIKDFQ